MPAQGIDVSDHEPVIDWRAVRAGGWTFGIAKATEGTGNVQARFAENWAGMKEAGLRRIAYHFARNDLENNPHGEAQHFLSIVAPMLEPGDCVALDIEQGVGAFSPWVEAWMADVQNATGCIPFLYSYPSFITSYLTDTALNRYPLWLASIEPNDPLHFAQWAQVIAWQWTWNERVNGVPTNVDGDLLNVTLAGLDRYGKPSPTPVVTFKHFKLTTAMHFRPSPNDSARPWGAMLPVDTKVVEVMSPSGAIEFDGWAFCRTSGDMHGWLKIANMVEYTP